VQQINKFIKEVLNKTSGKSLGQLQSESRIILFEFEGSENVVNADEIEEELNQRKCEGGASDRY